MSSICRNSPNCKCGSTCNCGVAAMYRENYVTPTPQKAVSGGVAIVVIFFVIVFLILLGLFIKDRSSGCGSYMNITPAEWAKCTFYGKRKYRRMNNTFTG